MLFNLESGIHPADHNVYKVISDSRCGIKFESVLMRLTNLEPIIQNKVSQKEKDKYHIIMHIYGIYKDGTEEFMQGSNGEMDIESRLMDMGQGEERVRCMERITWKLILP